MGPFHGMDPLVEASGGQEQYYMNGLIPWNRPPSRGIWWSRAVLCEWAHSVEWTHPPVEASGCQEQYYVNGPFCGMDLPVEAFGGQEQYFVNGLILWSRPTW